jgi:hypothetical protein
MITGQQICAAVLSPITSGEGSESSIMNAIIISNPGGRPYVE